MALDSGLKRRRAHHEQGDEWSRSTKLVDLLRSRSSSAVTFFDSAYTKEQVVFAAIAELRACQLQVELLQTKLELLQERRRNNIDSTKPEPPDSLSVASPPLAHNTSCSSSSTVSAPSDSDSCHDTSWSDSSFSPALPAEVLPTPSLDMGGIYRDFFRNSDLPQAVFTPSFHIVDCNQGFVNGFPFLLYGPMSVDTFLRQRPSLVAMHPPQHMDTFMQRYNQVVEHGVFHMENSVPLPLSASPIANKLRLDMTLVATFDAAPDGTKRLRYVTMFRRGARVDPSLTLRDMRMAVLGQPHPLPLPNPPTDQDYEWIAC